MRQHYAEYEINLRDHSEWNQICFIDDDADVMVGLDIIQNVTATYGSSEEMSSVISSCLVWELYQDLVHISEGSDNDL